MEMKPEGRDIYFTEYDNLIPVESLLGLGTPDGLSEGRQTGRSFRRALLTLMAASSNPGHWIQIKDHEYGSDNYLGDLIRGLLQGLNKGDLFQTRSDHEYVSHGKRNFFIRYNPRHYSPSQFIFQGKYHV